MNAKKITRYYAAVMSVLMLQLNRLHINIGISLKGESAMKKVIPLIIGMALSIQCVSAVSLYTYAESDIPQKQIFTVSPSELTMIEGETCKLSVTVDPEFANEASVYLYPSYSKTLVSADGTVTAYSCGEESISVSVSVLNEGSDTGKCVYYQSVKIHIQPDETLPAETRSELDRLQAQSPIGDFQRRTLELLGILDENAPRITAEQVDEILQNTSTPEEMIAKINEIHGYPDYIWRGDPGDCAYWLDEKGSDQISIVGGAMFFHSKIYDDGTVKEVTALYPPELSSEMSSLLDYSDNIYLEFNQIPRDYNNPVRGDANHDGIFNLADVVTLEKWLLAIPDTKILKWEIADFNQDGKLNAIDLTLMKRQLLYK